MARKGKGPRLVEEWEGSGEARRRLRLILETVSGEKGVGDAARELGVSESRFHEMRSEALRAALGDLEPRSAGRPSKQEDPKDRALAEKEAELRELRFQLRAAQLREELAILMPHVLKPRRGEKKPAGPGAGRGTPKAGPGTRRAADGGLEDEP